MHVKVIHAYKKLEEIQRDLVELGKLKERIAEDRDYSGYLKESFEREITKISGFREELLHLSVDTQSSSVHTPTLTSSRDEGQKLYEEKETHYRKELAQEQSTPQPKETKKKTERTVYKY